MCMVGNRRVEISISEENMDILQMLEEIKQDNRGFYSNEICRLIRRAKNQESISSLPRIDMFHKYKVKGKCVAEALYNGDITEKEIAECFMSCKIFLEEMYSSPRLVKIVDKHCGNIDISRLTRGLDNWLLVH